MSSDPSCIARFAALWLILGGAAAFAHEGHDHGPAAPAAPATVQPRGEAHSEHYELVAVAQGDELVVYLDRFVTNEPVTEATLEVETPQGPAAAVFKDGAYRVAASWLAGGGHIDLVFTVTEGDTIDILPASLDVPVPRAQAQQPGNSGAWLVALRRHLTSQVLAGAAFGFLAGVLLMASMRRRSTAAAVVLAALAAAPGDAQAHEGHDHGPLKLQAAMSGDRASRQPDGAIHVPKPVQRIFAIRTAMTENGRLRRAVELPGRVIPDPNASGFVQASVGGRISPPPAGFPRLGTRVRQGDVLAYVTPPLQAIDLSDMRQRQGELDQQIAIVERRLRRFETLAPSGAIARSQLEETRLELEGLHDRRTALESLRREPEPLVAPVDGVIADGTPVAGQIVQNNAVVFHIVDPAKLWVEALSFHALGAADEATARTAAGASLSLAFRGAGLADRSQSVPVHFAIGQGAGGLRPGELVTVFAQTGEPVSGIVLPRDAAVRAANGQHFVFEHVAAERFEPRPVRIEPLDSGRILVSAGIDRGRRIVVQGAELLDQIR